MNALKSPLRLYPPYIAPLLFQKMLLSVFALGQEKEAQKKYPLQGGGYYRKAIFGPWTLILTEKGLQGRLIGFKMTLLSATDITYEETVWIDYAREHFQMSLKLLNQNCFSAEPFSPEHFEYHWPQERAPILRCVIAQCLNHAFKC